MSVVPLGRLPEIGGMGLLGARGLSLDEALRSLKGKIQGRQGVWLLGSESTRRAMDKIVLSKNVRAYLFWVGEGEGCVPSSITITQTSTPHPKAKPIHWVLPPASINLQ